ncbi:MAG: metal ABC transporter permease [Candidatus Eisenbacteria bacterium]|nr:metal ABC transporter permease [Candidatus Latescibacterota bacterium]MBD3300859.1 metal ABC transporter permease [Candidatus Eisenbacteria bacterium]
MLAEWLEFAFLRRALAAGLLVALAAGLLSPFIVLRRMAFAGHGLAHAAFGGAALFLLLGGGVVAGGSLFALLLAVLLAFWTRRGRISEDSAIGIIVPGAMAIGVIALALRKTYTQDLFGFLFGNILSVLPGDLAYVGAVTAAVVVAMIAFSRGFVSTTFHEELARVEGWPVDRLRGLFLVLVAGVVVASMKIVGIVLVSALLVVPGATALLFARSFAGVRIASIAIGIGSVLVGMFLSVVIDLPSGAVIALVLVVAYAIGRILEAVLAGRAGGAARSTG